MKLKSNGPLLAFCLKSPTITLFCTFLLLDLLILALYIQVFQYWCVSIYSCYIVTFRELAPLSLHSDLVFSCYTDKFVFGALLTYFASDVSVATSALLWFPSAWSGFSNRLLSV